MKYICLFGLLFLAGLASAQIMSDCCVVHLGYAGCDESSCEDCVCAMDPWCCSVNWDGICTSEAENECAASCSCSGQITTPTTIPEVAEFGSLSLLLIALLTAPGFAYLVYRRRN